MSVNYHAYQSRGVLFENYEKVCGQWREKFSGYDSDRVAGILHLKTDETHLYISYFGQNYRLCTENGCLEKEQDNEWSEELYFNEAMVIYHLLNYVKDDPSSSGTWVPGQSLDGAVSRQSMPDPLLDPFAAKFTGKAEILRQACRKLGGTELETGDVAFEFAAFPFLHLRLIFWDADEDFPAQTQVLVDSHVTDYIHYETVGCITSDLLEKLENKVK